MSRMYLIDFDTEIKKDFSELRLLRNNEVFEIKKDAEVMPFVKRLVRIEEVTSLGFEYQSLDFEEKISEWYELVLLKATRYANGVTLVYHPEMDEFEVLELDMKFEDIRKVEAFIKAFKR